MLQLTPPPPPPPPIKNNKNNDNKPDQESFVLTVINLLYLLIFQVIKTNDKL